MLVATLFDKDFAREGLLCLESAWRHGATLVLAFPLDDEAEEACENLPRVSLRLVEERFPWLLKLRAERRWGDYVLGLKPFLFRFALELVGDGETAALVDSDVYFWGAVHEAEQAMNGLSIMVCDREIPDSAWGRFNGGFVACRRDERAAAFLEWWGDRCAEWCKWEFDETRERYAEEKYLDKVPDLEGGGVCPHPGVNLAPWNVKRHQLGGQPGSPTVDGLPVVCFHYQKFRASPDLTKMEPRASVEALYLLYEPYARALGVR